MRFRKLAIFGIFLCAGLVAVGAWLYQDFNRFRSQALNIPAAGLELYIAHGSSYTAIVRQLAENDVTEASWHWRLLGRLRRDQGRDGYQAGEYRFASGLVPDTLLDQLASGDVVHYAFSMIEGWTVSQMRKKLAEMPRLEHVTIDWSDQQLAEALGITALSDDSNQPVAKVEDNILEGWFLPASYDYHLGHTDLDILKRAHTAMRNALEEIWAERDESLPYARPYDLLTMASIVEKETGLPEERPAVAGVFVRRLRKGMRLQTDPTIIYGLGSSFDGNLKRIHLRTDGPYNTYTRHGLPPTPIALVGVAALKAAAHPEPGKALYFVATGDGGHVFSNTLNEHERNVDRYQRRRRSKP